MYVARLHDQILRSLPNQPIHRILALVLLICIPTMVQFPTLRKGNLGNTYQNRINVSLLVPSSNSVISALNVPNAKAVA